MKQLENGHRTSRDNDDFVSDFFGASRLHFIGSWRDRYGKLLDTLPPPPSLPKPPTLGGSRVYAHIDMDCFFASVATRGHPELDGLPVAVAWSGNSGGNAEIASCNYAARAHGIKNGMWIKKAKELCPHLIAMPYTFEQYASTADKMYRAVFATTPHVMGVSVDECYADLTGLSDPEESMAQLRRTIFQQCGCNASIGIGPNRLLARLATKRAKPNGLVRLTLDDARAMLRDESVSELPQVGYDKVQKLEAIGVYTCGDVLRTDVGKLQQALGPKHGKTVRAFANGTDERPWDPNPQRKSIGAQSSWGVRFNTMEEALKFTRKLALEVGQRLKAQGLRGSMVVMKVWRAIEGAPEWARKGSMGHGMCDIVNRSLNLPNPTNDGERISSECQKVLKELRIPAEELRGMGISAGKLTSGGGGGGGRALPAVVAAAPPPSKFSPDRVPKWYHSNSLTGPGGKAKQGPNDDYHARVIAAAEAAKAPAPAAAAVASSTAAGKRPREASPPPPQLAEESPEAANHYRSRSQDEEGESPSGASQAALADLHEVVEGMKEVLRLSYATSVVLPSGGGGEEEGEGVRALIALMVNQLSNAASSSAAAGGRFRQEALSDATDGLLRFARELAMSSLLTQRVPASKAMAWLAEVDRAKG